MMENPKFVDAQTAAMQLGISRATLYAYVSRGLLVTQPHPSDPRARLYATASINALRERKNHPRQPRKAAAQALNWGLPAVETAISNITAHQIFYRGENAITLSEHGSLEDVAALLWGSAALEEAHFDKTTIPNWTVQAAALASIPPLQRALALLPLILQQEPQGLLSASGSYNFAGYLIKALATALTPPIDTQLPLHEALAKTWDKPEAADGIRRALVLCADHEMNASTFTVRVIASTGAKLGASLLGGIAALSGPKHGGAIARVTAFHAEAAHNGNAQRTILARLARGEDLAGFGHRLYPQGDPRAAALLKTIPHGPDHQLAELVTQHTGLHPSIDFALCTLERYFQLPAHAGLILFAIGRSVGWVAHAIEQSQSGQMIRPRAHYTPSV